MAITVKSSVPAEINKASVFSNEDQEKVADLRGGLIRLQYYESILQDTVRVTLFYTDTGSTIKKDGKLVSAVEGLPMVGQERVDLIFTDNNQNEISFTEEGKNPLYINKITPILDDTTKSLVMLDLVSKEYILNEKMRLNTRFDGKISDHVKGILTRQMVDPETPKEREKNYLDTEKDLDIEPTGTEYNFCGDNRKPFYVINWLSKKAVPGAEGNPEAFGNSAGYFLWETAETTNKEGKVVKGGFHFRSIDWLMNKEVNPKKKSIIYTDSPDGGGEKIPEGYDIKALAAEKSNAIDIQKKLQMGAFSTRTIMFNPFDCKYEIVSPNAYGDKDNPTDGMQDKLKTAGEKLPVMNPEFDMNKREGGEGGDKKDSKEFSRTQYMMIDSGTLIANGARDPKEWSEGTKEQLTKSQTQENFEIGKILSQSSMRYNQLFSSKVTVTIPGDFSLHAGNSIFFDGPELTDDPKKDSIDEKDGGLYIIADICHYSSDRDTYTKMNLVRDSIERKGTPTGG